MAFVIHVNTVISDGRGKVLLVREKKAEVFDKFNFPGGHLEQGEALAEGARREVKEEVGIDVKLLGLIGVYTGYGNSHYLNFVFAGEMESGGASTVANKDQINSCGWFELDKIGYLEEWQILNPNKFRKIIEDYRLGRLVDLSFIGEDL